MAKVLNLYEAKSRLSSLVEEAAAGTEIVIAKAGVPRARLVAIKSRVRRRPGGSQGRVRIAADFEQERDQRLECGGDALHTGALPRFEAVTVVSAELPISTFAPVNTNSRPNSSPGWSAG